MSAKSIITDSDLLKQVKNALGITGTHLDATLTIFIDDVKEYMKDAGVNSDIVQSSASIGVIARGVSDLWNYGNGNTDFSPYFMQRVTQLAFKEVDEDNGDSI